jgi:hypothetical protein
MPPVDLHGTSSWFAALPDNLARIGISRGVPRRQSGYRMYRRLAPGSYFKSVGVSEYRERYMAALALFDPEAVLADINAISDGRIPVLLCFEPPDADAPWCHRGYVSAWFHDTLGLEVCEWGDETLGFGWAHPKIPPQFRRPRGNRR